MRKRSPHAQPVLQPRAAAVIAHLGGREKALEAFGWTGRRAEWIALACLHGGVFTRAQWTSFLGSRPEKVRRAVRALVAQGLAVEEAPAGIQGIGRVCRIRASKVYRAIGAGEFFRRRRITSRDVLMRRLLSLDYVLDHPRLPWLPTEAEKVAAFEGARDRAPGPPPAELPGRGRERPAPLSPRAGARAGRGARRLRLRRSRPRDRDGATRLGRGAPRAMGIAPGSRTQDRSRSRRADLGGVEPSPDGARQLGERSAPIRIRRGDRPGDRGDRGCPPQRGRQADPRGVRRHPGRPRAAGGTQESGSPTVRSGVVAPGEHMADGSARGEAVLTGIRPPRCCTGDVYFTSRSAGHGIRPRMGHCANAASRYTAGGCATATRFADVERGVKAVDGSDPPLAMPSAGIAEGWDVHAHPPSSEGRSRQSVPCGKAIEPAFRGWLRPCAEVVASGWTATACSAASMRR